MADDEWARTSIAVFDADDAAEHVDLSGPTLDAQLDAAREWLERRGRDRPSTDREVRLFCSWTPRPGQRAMTLPPDLVRLLADANGYVWIDFYPAGE